MIRLTEAQIIELENHAIKARGWSQEKLDRLTAQYGDTLDSPHLDVVAVADGFLELTQQIRRAGLLRS